MGTIAENKLIQFERLKETVRKEHTPLELAILEDEAVRLASYQRSVEYLEIVEKEKNHTPQWMWLLMFFVLGYLMCLSEPAMFYMVWHAIK